VQKVGVATKADTAIGGGNMAKSSEASICKLPCLPDICWVKSFQKRRQWTWQVLKFTCHRRDFAKSHVDMHRDVAACNDYVMVEVVNYAFNSYS
jgi:hypothetical protein